MPDWTKELRARLAHLRLEAEREAEIVDEMSQHLEERYEELRADGATPEEARGHALDEVRPLAETMRPLRQANRLPTAALGEPQRAVFADAWQDLRLAVRRLGQQPAFAAAAILTVALGIGANSAMFALVDAALLRPLPFPQPDRLLFLAERTADSERAGVSPLDLLDWESRSRALEKLGGFVPNVGSMVLAADDGSAVTVPRQWVTAGYLDALGVKPVAGRLMRAEDDRSRTKVVVLNERFWRAQFGAETGVVGRQLVLDGMPFTVVGVAPEEAQVFGRTDIWAMNPISGAPPKARGVHPFHVVGRLKPGATLEAARADLGAVMAALATEFPDTNAGRGLTVMPLHERVIGGDLRRTSLLFLGVVGVVLLLCCANVASLLLARATRRVRELGIRAALGADRPRILRQLMTESLVLAALGGVAGLALGAALLQAAPALLPEGALPPALRLAFDLRVLAFCAAATLGAGVLFGSAPAWQASLFPPAQALLHDGRTATGSSGRLRAALVVGEVATAVALLFGAGLLLRTLAAVEGVDRGYDAQSVLSMTVDPLGSRYPTDEKLLQFYEEVEREVRAVPGVGDVAWATTLPLGESENGEFAFELVGEELPVGGRTPSADYQIVSPSYLRTLGVPVVEGRAFDERDRAGSTLVAMVNEAFVRRHLGGRSPIGRRLALRPADEAGAKAVVREVVGVARQVKGRPDETEEFVQVYVPLAQELTGDIFMLARPADGNAEVLRSGVRAAIGRVDKDRLVSVRNIMTLDEVASQATGRQRFRAVLVACFAVLAMVLAMVGLFGLVAYAVQQRVRELGVRRALGAAASDVLRSVVGSALRLVAIGVLLGSALSLAVGRLVSSLLFGVSGVDPLTFGLALLALAVTVLFALALPTWRALQVEPAVALRVE
jgi:putative ABC transport system permease protein